MWPAPSSRRRTVVLGLVFFLVTSLSIVSYQHRETIRAHGAQWLARYRYARIMLQVRPEDHGLIDLYPLAKESGRGKASEPIRDDAHTLASADDFHSHFAAVTSMQGLTYEEGVAGCDAWQEDEYINFNFGEDEKWVLKPTNNVDVDGRRRQWQNWVRTQMIPWEDVKDRFSGRGLVIVGGNHNTLERIKVTLRALVEINSTVPIELHYWNDEVSQKKQDLLSAMYPHGIFFNDLSKPHNLIKPRKVVAKMPNYGFKPAALLNSRFAEPLLLDADNIPVIRPELLWESATYSIYHSIFWPDISRTRPQNPIWAVTNTACRTDEYEQESGQLLVDKTRFWYHLQLASWMANEQGPPYYNTYLLGDKDCFRFAWHMLKTTYGRPMRWLASAGTLNEWTNYEGNVEQTYCGYAFAQHHPDPDGGQAQVAFMHGGTLKSVHPELLRWNKERGGIFRHYKRSPMDTTPGDNSAMVRLKWDGVDYFDEGLRGPKFVVPSCTDMDAVEARQMDELVPGWEEFFDGVGGYWLLDRPDLQPPY